MILIAFEVKPPAVDWMFFAPHFTLDTSSNLNIFVTIAQ